MSLRVRLYTIWCESDLADVAPPCSRLADLAGADGKTSSLFLGFANGCFLEARAIGESPAAMEAFRRRAEVFSFAGARKMHPRRLSNGGAY